MKKLFLFLAFVWLVNISVDAQSIDTLQWLKTNIEQKKSFFVKKPFKLLLDSLKGLKNGIVEYSGPSWYLNGLNDTIWVKGINLYLGDVSSVYKAHKDHFFANKGVDTLNTHIKVLSVDFSWPVLFRRKWWSDELDGRGSDKWNKKVEDIYKEEWVSDLKVYEY